MARLALMTVGLLHVPSEHPSMREFGKVGLPTFAAAEASEGFISRSYWPEPDAELAWGEAFVPDVFQQEQDAGARNTPTLSLWTTIDAVFAFAYSGIHAKALTRRRDWFMTHKFPGYVLWWVADDHIPSWREADDRYDVLCREGSTPQAFDFKHPFDADGRATTINRDLVHENTQKEQK